MTAAGQFEVSEEILKMANESNTPQLLVLAGLTAGLEDKRIHVICSDGKIKTNLERNDIEVSKDQPKEGIIGIAGLIISLSPIYKVPTVGLIAETVGASADILAANRMAVWIDAALNIPLDLDLDTTEETAKKIMERIKTSKSIDDLLSSEENEVSSDFYV
jgi:proteasome assembly chaperone (PAC2) family protein